MHEADSQVRGASLGLFASDPAYDYGVMLRELAARGARDVLIVVPWAQTHRLSNDPGPRADLTPSDATLTRTLSQARTLGLRIGLMPILRLPDEAKGRWRGALDPTSVSEWFASYTRALLPLAEQAEAKGAVRLVVGSELLSLEHEADHWRRLIRSVRTRFSGRVVYATNWDDLSIPFADALDEVGVSAYFPMAAPFERPSARSLARRWEQHRVALSAFAADTGKPVIVTEVGYPARERAAEQPWYEDAGAALAPELQATLLHAACSTLAQRPLLGVYVWNWFGFGGPSDGTFSPRGKPAAAVLERCFRHAEEKP